MSCLASDNDSRETDKLIKYLGIALINCPMIPGVVDLSV